MDNLNNDELKNFIKKCGFFHVLTDKKIDDLIPHFKEITLKRDDILFHQGDMPHFLYILIKGKLSTTLKTSAEGEKMMGIITPIETVGELGALSGELRSLTVKAVTDSKILRLPSKIFLETCHLYPEVLHDISKLIIKRSLETIKLIAKAENSIISLVFPIDKNLPWDNIQQKLREHGKDTNTTFITFDENLHKEQLMTAIKDARQSSSPLVILMHSWQLDVFTLCEEQINNLYLYGSANQVDNAAPTINEVFRHTKNTHNIRVELVLFHPDETTQPQHTKTWLDIANFSLHHHVRLTNQRDYQRLIRFMTGRASVLVLSGGGAKGFAHIGAIKAILEHNIPIDMIGGSSIGSSIAGWYAMTQNYPDMLALMESFALSSYGSLSLRHITWPLISLFSGSPITEDLEKEMLNISIEDLWIPYFSVASNLTKQIEIIYSTGPLSDAIRSSGSLPGVFPPVTKNGELIFDGGLLNIFPVDIMREKIGRGHKIIGVTLKMKRVTSLYQFPTSISFGRAILSRLKIAYRDDVYPPFLETFIEALSLGATFKELNNCKNCDILISPDLTGFRNLSISKITKEQLIELGYNEAVTQILKNSS